MKLPNIYVDLDGVLADFDQQFRIMFPELDKNKISDDTMWSHINSREDYFRTMPPFERGLEFFRKLATGNLEPIILTACPKSNYVSAALQKRDWCRRYLHSNVIVLPVMGGRHKGLFMHRPGDVLIDDHMHNIDAWRNLGGYGIYHDGHFVSTEFELAKYLKEY